MGNKKLFIDTNIWLYSIVQSEKQHATSVQIISQPDSEVYITSQILNEVCFSLLKQGLMKENLIHDLISDFYEKYIIINTNKQLQLKSSQIRSDYGVSFWDSQVIAGALISECMVIYSDVLNPKLRIEELQIVNPFI